MAMVVTKKTVKIFGIIGSLVVAALGINFAVMPTINNISTKNEEIASTQEDIALRETSRDALLQSKDSFGEIKTLNQNLSARFPETGQTQPLIEQFLYGASINGIPSDNVTSIQFNAPEVTTPEIAPAAPAETEEAAEGEAAPTPDVTTAVPDGYGAMEVTLSLEATSSQVQGFLNYLNTLNRAVLIKSVSMTGNPETGVIQLGLTAKVFIYKPIPEPSTTASAPEDGVVEVTPSTEE